jgi:hypothetical protein
MSPAVPTGRSAEEGQRAFDGVVRWYSDGGREALDVPGSVAKSDLTRTSLGKKFGAPNTPATRVPGLARTEVSNRPVEDRSFNSKTSYVCAMQSPHRGRYLQP